MTKQRIEDIIKLCGTPITHNVKETLYLLDKEQIEEIAQRIVGDKKRMKIKLDAEMITEIRNALTIINLAAQTIDIEKWGDMVRKTQVIEEQVKRIDKLLPQVEFEDNLEPCPKRPQIGSENETQNSSTL